MAYNAVAHSDSGSNLSRSSTPASPSLHPDGEGLTGLGAIIRSMTSASYESVEDDDYHVEHQNQDPNLDHDIPLHVAPLSVTPLNTAISRHSPQETPLQSPTTSIPLSHPTPDLQSLQGAYVGNVERLEESAMRLSSSSADIASEIRKMDLEQKRRSCSSSNSIMTRNEAFSPGAMSPHGSNRSTRQRSVSGASRLAQVAEPIDEEQSRILGIFASPFPIPSTAAPAPAPQPRVYPQRNERYYRQWDGVTVAEDGHVEAGGVSLRPSSAASGDTYQQAQTLFNGFDGVHFMPQGNSGRQFALNRPPLASTPQSYREPQTGEHMVFYPAPVPRMLNLPPKLSRNPITDREKRRTQLLTTIATEDRKKAVDEISQSGNDNANDPKNKHQSVISPHLRASVFFDPPRTTLEVEVKQQSAVATLDSILDASAHAPVSAFTDHPFAGHVGSHVYNSSKRNTILKKPSRNSQFPMGQRQSTLKEEDGSVTSNSASNSEDETDLSDETGTGSEEHTGSEEEEEDELDYVGPPNTLLAELVLRKHELAQRRRTALPVATDTGRYGATLLELDARAQRQSDKRRNRPVTLAWNPNDQGDDDEVPLGVLYADRGVTEEEDRPLGLLEKRAHEENEPLSSRRARLRGEPSAPKRPVSHFYASAVFDPSPPEPEPESEESDHEGETMAERLKRLKGENPSQSDFANELMAEIDTRAGIESHANVHTKRTEPEPEPVNEEETLAQRRSRLQKENAASPPQPKPRVRQSMVALPQVRPAPMARKSSHDVLQQFGGRPQYGAHRMSMQPYPVQSSYGSYHAPMAQPMAQSYNYGMVYPPPRPYSQVNTMPMNGMAYPMQHSYNPAVARQTADPAQLDMVDRWRQSIR